MLETQNGDTLQVVLSGNPTTGYNWSTTQIDDAVLKQESDPAFDAESDLLGAPGRITTSYKAIATGTSPLSLDYGPVGGGDAESSFSITVVVE